MWPCQGVHCLQCRPTSAGQLQTLLQRVSPGGAPCHGTQPPQVLSQMMWQPVHASRIALPSHKANTSYLLCCRRCGSASAIGCKGRGRSGGTASRWCPESRLRTGAAPAWLPALHAVCPRPAACTLWQESLRPHFKCLHTVCYRDAFNISQRFREACPVLIHDDWAVAAMPYHLHPRSDTSQHMLATDLQQDSAKLLACACHRPSAGDCQF